jgi:hypothetical protein
MRKTAVMVAVLALTAVAASAAIIDEWDMNDNGQWQNSNNGLNLGAHYSSNNQQVAQVDDDGTFIFSPTATPQGFSGKTDLSSVADLTAGVVTLSYTYTAMDWSANPAANSQVGFRLWNSAGSQYVGMSFQDTSDKIWAYTKSSAGLGGLNAKTGRLINGLVDSSTPRTVKLELDYANSEVRMYADTQWQWSPSGVNAVFTNSVDFASAGVTDIAKFQTYYQNWGTGDTATVDNIRIEAIPEPATLSMIGLVGSTLLILRRRVLS